MAESEDVRRAMAAFCTPRASFLSNHLLLVRSVHELTEKVLAEARDHNKFALAEALRHGNVAANNLLNLHLTFAEGENSPLVSRAALFSLAYGSTEHELVALSVTRKGMRCHRRSRWGS